MLTRDGRATTVPSVHTANNLGDVVFGYSPEDRITSQKQGTVQTDYTFDVLGRRYQDKVGTTVKTVRHYLDETDNPSWVTGTGTSTAQTDLYTPSLGSSLNATRKVNGTITTTYLNVGNLHGDTIISLQLPATGYVTGPSELNVYDEYGLHQAPENDNRPVGIGNYADTSQLFVLTYGSLGQPQRETTDTGIQFMGARGYNPITGQFLSPDPVQGGNETPYNYPNDPINKSDISGRLGLLASMAIDWAIGTIFMIGIAGPFVEVPGLNVVMALVAADLAARCSSKIQGDLDAFKPKEKVLPKRKYAVSDEQAATMQVGINKAAQLAAKESKKYRSLRSKVAKLKFLKKVGGVAGKLFDYLDRGARITDDYLIYGSKVDFFSEWIY